MRAQHIDDERLDRLREIAGEIARHRTQTAPLRAERDELVVELVDDGIPQDQVAAAADLAPSRITAILADPRHYQQPAAAGS